VKTLPGHEMRVAILLGTYNGQRHLREQLNSIVRQHYSNWIIYASDDGSKDGTLDILSEYREKYGVQRIEILHGPCKGFSENFMSLVQNRACAGDFFAFCDQDDIWHPEKISRALDSLLSSKNQPALYCSRTRLIDESGNFRGLSNLIRKPPSFANAVVQSIAGGNTMVFNKAARDSLLHVGMQRVVSHDWWLYILITGIGGRVVYDQAPSLDYRQHEANLVGYNGGWRARISRTRMAIGGRFKEWNDTNMAAIEAAYSLLTSENQYLYRQFHGIKSRGRLRDCVMLLRSGVHRQTLVGNTGLLLAHLLNRL
jgi:glycosyltransferase involved in cell wall biosynthesis